eukprot:CAMPEP_0119345010 /NCGR_PEP_ID=MMETSP1333-20130426/107265_1 /TAXON_ID=418940 /ORGANISM="Scyphosphaera apsteinii, Strain RCC1455" /LENGTH=329 /DNA_ID=CAMNT_0007357463 /DNA_START=242 /DNA_END=1232 /DNA_ORIENTATION=+
MAGLVLLEYTQNMYKGGMGIPEGIALERLIRRLLQLPSRPALVLVNLPLWAQLLPTTSEIPACARCPEEKFADPLASFYHLPSVSLSRLLISWGNTSHELAKHHSHHRKLWRHRVLSYHKINRTAGWFQCSSKDNEGLGRCGPSPSEVPHPNQIGHFLVARALAYLLQRACIGDGDGKGHRMDNTTNRVVLDDSSVNYRVDSPSYHPLAQHGRLASECVGPDRIRDLVYGHEVTGWKFTVEGTTDHPKPGLVAWHRGDEITLCVTGPIVPVAPPRKAVKGSKDSFISMTHVHFFSHWVSCAVTILQWALRGSIAEEDAVANQNYSTEGM